MNKIGTIHQHVKDVRWAFVYYKVISIQIYAHIHLRFCHLCISNMAGCVIFSDRDRVKVKTHSPGP